MARRTKEEGTVGSVGDTIGSTSLSIGDSIYVDCPDRFYAGLVKIIDIHPPSITSTNEEPHKCKSDKFKFRIHLEVEFNDGNVHCIGMESLIIEDPLKGKNDIIIVTSNNGNKSSTDTEKLPTEDLLRSKDKSVELDSMLRKLLRKK